MSKKRIYGIDLGTTYSCIARVDDYGRAEVINNSEGAATTPSVVYFENADNIVVGKSAKEVAAIYPDQCVETVKRNMGAADACYEIHGNRYSPQTISSFILRKLVADAEQNTGEEITDVVITCPAYFGVNEKEATRQAGEIAGLTVHYVIPEPTAAALAYGIEQKEDQVVLVYDLGGGTFDITLIEIKDGNIQVICTGGDHQLGGKDWDGEIVEFLAQRYAEATSTNAQDLLNNEEYRQELHNLAEECKKALTSRTSFQARLAFDGGRQVIEITREAFADMTSHHLASTIDLTREEIDKAREKGYDRIDKLLLVGGSTYMPRVMQAVKEHFDVAVLQFDPNQAVAKGAAVYAQQCHLVGEVAQEVANRLGQPDAPVDLDQTDKRVVEEATKAVAHKYGLPPASVSESTTRKIVNVTAKSFGMQTLNRDHDEVVVNLITKNTSLPVEKTQEFYTVENGQTQVLLRLMENNFDGDDEVDPADSQELAQGALDFGCAMPKSSPIEVTYRMRPDGLLHVTGRCLTTGKEYAFDYQSDAVLNPDDLAATRQRSLAIQVS